MSLALLQKGSVMKKRFTLIELLVVIAIIAILAALLLAMLPILILYVFLQRYIIEGVTSGAVKG